MPKTRDVPTELREFNSLFSLLIRRNEISNVYDDFLTIIICCLARQTQEEWYLQTIKKYNKDEMEILPKLLGTLFMIYEKKIAIGDWFDPLGTYYELLASNYKKSNLGQFFTPETLCKFMAQITIDANDFGNNIMEPACGSGRLILAANAIAKGNHYTAIDLDHICVKMTCINLAFYGIKGTVYHANALSNEKPFNVYSINQDYHKTKTPLILKVA